MNNIFKNKKGITIAEALISMVLLAMITVGIYGVIMASMRSAKKPNSREEIAFAIDHVNTILKSRITRENLSVNSFNICRSGGTANYGNPSVFNITNCTDPQRFLPEMCDASQSTFEYTVTITNYPLIKTDVNGNPYTENKENYSISFNVSCNGVAM
ncbi:type II secretory pathway pseudopilin PulG [Elusimicrobium posterum]|uniref:hypothetical protein n=1 Tax=Elusimicrobium posterum TaxID=3116653 RepID=UPI003C70853C